MKKETIIKGLECCTRGRKSKDDRPCLECSYNECNIVGGTSERQTSGTCQGWLMKDAIALIKELTEENERLESISINKDITIEAINEVIKQLNEENERLKNICNSYALQYGTARDKEVFLRKERADTVKRFAERLKKECLVDSGYEVLQIGTIDRIADEILNKNTEE